MNFKKCPTLFISGFLVLLNSTHAEESAFRFLATGDVPYSKTQEVQYRKLLKQAEQEKFTFLLHVGDIKAQSIPCTDAEFEKIRDLFRQYPAPVVYTPGDNEWTDCYTFAANPIERLTKLRQLFFHDETVLRLSNLNTQHQSRNAKFGSYIENYRFTKSDILFIVTHVCGSGNNRRVDDLPSMKEFRDRNAANLAFLKESFTKALANDAPGVAVIIHANPDFENGKQEGFHDFLNAIRTFLAKYHKPVVCIHGDSHYFRIDKPFRDLSGTTYLNFTRMEVFGSPNVVGVSVTVDPEDPLVFSYRPYYLKTK